MNVLRFRTLSILVAAAALSLISLKFLPVPYVWGLLAFAAAMIFAMRDLRSPATKAIALNAAVCLIVLAGAEAYFSNAEGTSVAPTYEQGYQIRDETLGVAPAKGRAARTRLVNGEDVVYDVTYSIDSLGLRVSPPVDAAVTKSIAFFGCSFTFGEGLSDAEAMPYRVGLLAHGKYQVRNFAFHGYGPQQMLAALEAGIAESALDVQPTHFVYQALPDHVARAAGIHSYQSNHPRYVLQSDGSVVRKGYFFELRTPTTERSELRKTIDYQLSKSYLLRWLMSLERQTTEADLNLWTAIVKQSRQRVRERYPGATFDVILWEWVNAQTEREKSLAAAMARNLEDAGIPVHSVSAILPDYDKDPAPFQLSPRHDRHPSALANDLIARYVVGEILHEQP